MIDLILPVLSLLSSLAALVVALRKRRGLSLTEIALRSIAAAEQFGGSNEEKLRKATQAARRLDEGDNGKRDFTDAQLRIAIEAELNRSKAW